MWFTLKEKDISTFHRVNNFDAYTFNLFVKANGFNRWTQPGSQDYKRFLTNGRDTTGFPHISKECPPFMDHARAFKNTETGIVCMVYQPYEPVDNVREAVKDWVIGGGLEAEVYDPEYSWYYPGHTCLVVIHLPGVEIKLR